jgi:hypothetical protein
MQQLFRDDYRGERIIINSDRVNGQVVNETQWVENTLNIGHSGYALVIGNGLTRKKLKSGHHIFTHHGGPTPLTVYGCNAAYRDFNPHVLVVKQRLIADEAADSGYADKNIVVTTASNIIRWENKFHLIPFDPQLNAGATGLYLAAFDGHKHVYFWAFDLEPGEGMVPTYYAGTNGYPSTDAVINYQRFSKEIYQVMKTYSTVEFIKVSGSAVSPVSKSWWFLPNFRQIDFDQFKREVSLGYMRSA